MKKRIIGFIIGLCMILSIIPLSDVIYVGADESVTIIASGNCGENITWTIDSDGVMIFSGTGELYSSRKSEQDEEEWDDHYNEIVELRFEKGITKIHNIGVFAAEKIVIADTVTEIDGFALSGGNLKIVFIPSSVKKIGEDAFYHSYRWKNPCLIIGEKGTAAEKFAQEASKEWNKFIFVEQNGSIVDGGSDNDAYWIIEGDDHERSLTILGSGSVDGWRSTKDVVRKGWSSLEKDDELITEVVIDGNITPYECPFSMLKALKTAKLTEKVTDISEYGAFRGCENLEKCELPSSISTIGSYTFYGCNNLSAIIIPNSVTSIEEYAFFGCNKLSSIDLPNNIASIGEYAFYGCSKLTSLTIPETTANIESGAFSGCNSLEKVVVSPDNKVYDSRNNCNALIETATNTLITGCKYSVIPNTILIIGEASFAGLNITDITIPDCVRSIENRAFSSCDLVQIVIPEGVEHIGGLAFYGCPLQKAYIPKSMTEPLNPYSFANTFLMYGFYSGDLLGGEGFTIYGYRNTSAEEFANEYELPFVDLDEYADESGNTVETKPAESMRPAVDPIKPSDSTKPTESAKPSASTKPTEPAKLAEQATQKPQTTTADNSGTSGNKSSGSTTGARIFPDVHDPSKPYYKPVYWAVNKGITVGYKNGNFGPADSCTRAQFVTFIWRLAGKPTPKATASIFSDVNKSMSAYKPIMWAVENGIIVGYKDGTFKPNAEVTRRQVAVMLWRWQGKPSASKNAPFTDISHSDSAYKAIQWGAEVGVIKGSRVDGQQVFKPDDNCQRQQIVTFLYRYARDVLKENVN